MQSVSMYTMLIRECGRRVPSRLHSTMIGNCTTAFLKGIIHYDDNRGGGVEGARLKAFDVKSMATRMIATPPSLAHVHSDRASLRSVFFI